MDCPECTHPMLVIARDKPINFASDIRFERWRCDKCKLMADVETQFYHLESPDAVSGES